MPRQICRETVSPSRCEGSLPASSSTDYFHHQQVTAKASSRILSWRNSPCSLAGLSSCLLFLPPSLTVMFDRRLPRHRPSFSSSFWRYRELPPGFYHNKKYPFANLPCRCPRSSLLSLVDRRPTSPSRRRTHDDPQRRVPPSRGFSSYAIQNLRTPEIVAMNRTPAKGSLCPWMSNTSPTS